MEKVDITVSLEKEQMVALEIFLKPENTTPKKKLMEMLQEVYEQKVPQTVRDFIDAKAKASSHGRHQPKPHAPVEQAELPAATSDSEEHESSESDGERANQTGGKYFD